MTRAECKRYLLRCIATDTFRVVFDQGGYGMDEMPPEQVARMESAAAELIREFESRGHAETVMRFPERVRPRGRRAHG